MTAKLIYRAVANVGKYTDKDGKEKNRTQEIGSIFENEKGFLSLKLNCLPLSPEWNGWATLYKNEPNESHSNKRSSDSFNDDIPF
jgi:hypothetical protein